MNQSTLTYPAPRTELTGQQLISHAGLSILGGLLNALDYGLCAKTASRNSSRPPRPTGQEKFSQT